MDNNKKIFTLNIINGINLKYSGEHINVKNKNAIAIITYLYFYNSSSISRPSIASMIWPNSDKNNAYASLRQTLKSIREIHPNINDAIKIDTENLYMNSDFIKSEFDILMHKLTNTEKINIDELPYIANNTILPGLDDIGDEFQDWLRQTRSSIERRYLATLTAKVTDKALGWPSRETLARTLIVHEPLNECAYRALIEGAARRGDIGSALSWYREIHQLLDAELGMEPSQATQDLAIRIKLDDSSLFQATPEAETPDPARIELQRDHIGEPKLAIMPLVARGIAQDFELLGEIVSEELTCQLFGLQELHVIAPASVQALISAGQNHDTAAQQLKVDYYLTGSLRLLGGQFRLTIQLVHTQGGLVIWAETFEFDEHAFPKTHDRIVRQIIQGLMPALRYAELSTASAFKIESLNAYQLVARAKGAMYQLDRAGFDEAERLLNLAIEREPRFANALVTKADWISLRIGQGWSSNVPADLNELVNVARAALRYGRQSPRALAILGHNHAVSSRRFTDARTLLTQAMEQTPGDSEVLIRTVPTLAYSGDSPHAITNALQAIALSPSDPLGFRYDHFASVAYFSAENYEESLRFSLRSYEKNNNYISNVRTIILSSALINDIETAKEFSSVLLNLDPTFTVSSYVNKLAFKSDEKRAYFGSMFKKIGLPD